MQVWRASPEHKLNLIVGPGPQSRDPRVIHVLVLERSHHSHCTACSGDVVVMVDAIHLGIYHGDEVCLSKARRCLNETACFCVEVLSVNDISVQSFRHFSELLESCGHSLEIQFYHKAPLCWQEQSVPFCCTAFNTRRSHQYRPSCTRQRNRALSTAN